MKVFLGIAEEKLGEILKNLRVEHNYTQKKVADYLDIHRTTYTKYETVRKPEIDVIMKLAALYDITVDEILGDFFETREDNVTPFRQASTLNDDGEKDLLSEDEKQLITLYRESIRKKEIIGKAKEIWASDNKMKNK